jgi:hypothetical protein
LPRRHHPRKIPLLILDASWHSCSVRENPVYHLSKVVKAIEIGQLNEYFGSSGAADTLASNYGNY